MTKCVRLESRGVKADDLASQLSPVYVAVSQSQEQATTEGGGVPTLDSQLVFEQVPALLLVLRPEFPFVILAASDAYLNATHTTRETIVGRPLFEVFPDNPEDPQARGAKSLRASLERVIETKFQDSMAVLQYDIRKAERDGSGFETRFWSPVNAPVFGPEGNILYITHRVEDVSDFVRVTQQNKKEHARSEQLKRIFEATELEILRRSQELDAVNQKLRAEIAEREQAEHQFRELIEAASDAIVIASHDGQIVLANSQAERWFGYSRHELIGQSVELLLPERFRQKHAGHRADYLSAPRSRPMGSGFDLFGQRKDGSEFPVEISLSSFETESGNLVISIVRDMTERKHSEELRTELQAQFRAVAETANDAIVSANGESNIVYVNPAAERIFGSPAADLTGQPMTLLFPERYHSKYLKAFADYLASSEEVKSGKTIEIKGRHQGGVEFPIELSLASWKVGKSVFATAILRDISERKTSEQSLRDYAAQLEASNRELEAFSYSVSHDLRAPLRSIDGFSQALLEDYSPQLDRVGVDYLNRVRAAAQRMGHLIDDLLTLARVARVELKPQEIDLSAIALEVAVELRKSEPTREARIDIEPGLKSRGDARLLRVAFENLLGNAWKFTSGRPCAEVKFGVTYIEGVPAYYVRDNGAGFDMTYAGKLFSAFQRLHEGHEFPGTGIGLATVQRVIHKHGGKIWADATPNRGATFYFVLPA